jgi:predicted  nucleic acid-binding Zn-ribbon protein
MNYETLKKLENNISAIQAKLGLLRAELKRQQGTTSGEEISLEIDALETEVDRLQTKYTKAKEVNHG